MLFSKAAAPFHVSTSSSTLVICLSDYRYPRGCEQVSHCGFDLYFLDDSNGFSRAYSPFVCLLWRDICSDPLPVI